MSRAAELTRARAARHLSEEDCMVWFGVGRATLERVEAGEVEPSPELGDKIDRFLRVCGGGFAPFASAAPVRESPIDQAGYTF